MSELLSQQQTMLHSVARALANFKKLGKPNYTPPKIRARIAALKEVWSQCTRVHAALLQAVTEAQQKEVEYFTKDEFYKHEDIYLSTLDYLTECLEELEPPMATSPLASSSHHFCSPAPSSISHLPPINIPPFNGKAEDWESFRDRFTSLIIKNKDLTAFSRMHFLASSLSGRALDSIKTVPITADNFEIAWQILTSRYDNKRRLVEVHASVLCNLPSVSRESAFELTELRDKANRAIASLKKLNRSSDEILSDILIHHVSQKLDPATKKAWKLKGGDDATIPTYEDLDRFLATRARALEELTPLTTAKSTRSSKPSSVTAATASLSPCPLCKQAHFLNKCPQFAAKSPSQRLEIVKQNKRCVNCLSLKHDVSVCPSRFSCRSCQQRHHSMLHLDSVSSSNATISATDSALPTSTNLSDAQGAVALCAMSANLARPPVLLATARVSIESLAGRRVAARALVDQGSEITFISAHLAKRLKLRRVVMPIAVSAVGGVDAGICRHAVQIKISPVNETKPTLMTTASILSSLTNYSSASFPSHLNWDHLADLTLADPHFSNSDPIELIIGADLYSEIIQDGIRKGPRGQPIAQSTIFGWILSGPASLSNSFPRTITVQHCTNAGTVSLDSELRRFWEIEEIPRQTMLSPEEQRCEDHFLTSHSRTSDGQYVVRLPFKNGPPIDIGASRDIAERCLKTLLRRLQANSDLKKEYSDFLREYENLGHMRKAPESSNSSQFVYIPHHPVIRESSATTRVRVVFNASSPTSNSRSLNDHLLAGQKLQTDLAAVLLRWRQYRYVYSADVAKMYRQIRVDPRDTDYQRILWLNADTGKIQEYQLLTVTYGTTSAPFLALRVLRQLVNDDGRDFPMAVPVLQENIYVDDVLFGADDLSLTRQVRNQVCSLLQRGRFELRKWSSNSSHLLSDIDAEDHGLACSKDLHPEEKLKVLGISWSPSIDAFQFRVVRSSSATRTKRSILSHIARMFDPLGWSTPVTVTAKVLLQRLWQLRVDWDDEVPPEIANQWESIQSSLLELDGLHLNRWIQKGSDTDTCELHGFSDASSYAYAAAIYIRITSLSGAVTSALLVGKSKVASIKTLTIPRLELSAAVLMSRLMNFVIDALHMPSAPCFCWTDSTVVLAWVTQHPSKWKTFISNRVAEIQTRLPSASWRYVPTDENPADCASRGISGRQLASHPLWWHGPAWLIMSESEWPTISEPFPSTALEESSRSTAHLVQTTESWELAERYSSWPRLIRVSAYVFRFISRIRKRNDVDLHAESPSSLTANEVRRAKVFWIKYIQRQLFPREVHALSREQAISQKSSLFSLNAFLDEEQIIRVGGRLSQAPIPFQARHPIILASHPLVLLLISHFHLRTLHAGTQLTLATLRQEFWLIRERHARSVVRSVLHKCVKCAREGAATPYQLMGNLPKVRVTPPSRAFLNTGLDYAGPVFIRSRSGRGVASQKAYIALFVCMATRAVHLELVEGYSTPAFLGAYSRFVARRGLPESIYSDNGTTFVGADRELTAAFRSTLRDPKLLNRTAADSVSWHFIPPSAPHFGGLWEAGVRSVKHHIRRVVGAHTLTFEEFSTLLCNVEACLNSRPLAPLSDSLDDYNFLTPGHFLIGAALNSIPEPSLLQLKENRLSRWQLVRQMTERLWKVWQNDYINTLQQRGKWRRVSQSTLQIGQLVLLRNPLLPPCKWEMGRVTLCHPGSDGLIRVVTVKTAFSEYKRPINKICILPIDIEKPSHVEGEASS